MLRRTVFRDIDLSSAGDVEIDLTNPNGSGVDGFVTSVGCDKLFEGAVHGRCERGALPGSRRARASEGVSERKKVAAGRYRIFAQGYAVNDAALSISLDLGVWSNACRWNPIAP